MSTLFNGDNSDSEGELNINNEYASNYNNWRQKEELNKLKTKYGNVSNESGSSEEDSEDSTDENEEEEELKEKFDKDFYKALAYLKNKDPRIYKEDVSFFTDTNKAQEERLQKKKAGEKGEKQKPVYLRDFERKIIVERDGKFSDSEDEGNTKEDGKMYNKVTYVEEQQQLKDSFKSAIIDEDPSEGADLLKPKLKSDKEKQQEEADYKQWLKGQKSRIDEEDQKELKPLRDFWSNPNLDANEQFLRDYILNNKYMEKTHTDVDLDYDQHIHDSDENLSEDEKNIEKQEEFEHKYNFRFEEPDRDFIKRYPRTMENSLRKKDTRRAQKRAEVKQRKEEEKLRKKEELMQLKALKRKEIEEKIEQLKEITGNDDIQFNALDLEGDFDPNEYDRKMTEIFNEDYYAGPEGDMKPEFPDIDEELDVESTWDNFDPTSENPALEDSGEPHCEDENFNMDADYDATQAQQQELINETRKRKRRKRTKFAELIATQKPKFDPKLYSSYAEYFDKYYSLDYEDMIGDLPCRFKYRKVVPNDYGLTVDEILTADDKELNKWCSLKKALQYKPEHVELNEVRTYKQKARDEALKRKVLRSLYSEPNEEENANGGEASSNTGVDNSGETEKEAKKKRRRNKKKVKKSQENDATDSKPPEDKNKGKKLEKAEKRKRKSEENNEAGGKRQKGSNWKEETISSANKVEQENANQEPVVKLTNGESETSTNPRPSKSLKESKKKDKLKKKLKKKQAKGSKNAASIDPISEIADLNPERLKTYGINAKKLKKKLKYGQAK